MGDVEEVLEEDGDAVGGGVGRELGDVCAGGRGEVGCGCLEECAWDGDDVVAVDVEVVLSAEEQLLPHVRWLFADVDVGQDAAGVGGVLYFVGLEVVEVERESRVSEFLVLGLLHSGIRRCVNDKGLGEHCELAVLEIVALARS